MPETQTIPTPATPDVKSALAGFTEDFRGFRTDLEERLERQTRRLDILDRKAVAAARPALETTDTAAPHRKAFDAYVRQGDEEALRGLDLEEKALNTLTAPDGGVLVDPQTAERIETVLRAGWITEASTVSDTATPSIDPISIPLHELNATPKASQRLLDDTAFDVEMWLAERIATRFARAENAAFVTGDGVDKPRGFLNHPTAANDSWSWGTIGTLETGTAGAFGSEGGDRLIDLVYALGAGYRANASFVMNSATAGEVRKLKDADGRYLWAEGLDAGQPARLLGYPVAIAEEMPDIGADADAIAFGDFRSAYTVAERPDLRILRDPYSAKPHVLFYATRRVGGDVTDFAAIKLLRFSA